MSYNINQHAVILPISKLDFGVGPLTCADLLSIKSSTNLNFHQALYNLLKIFHSKISIPPLNPNLKQLVFNIDSFLNYISYYEIELISYVFMLSTFETETQTSYTKTITCSKCSENIKISASLSQYIDSSSIKVWDKNASFFNFLFKQQINIDKNILTIYYKIPTAYEYLYKLSGLNKATIIKNFNEHGDILDEVSKIVIHINKIEFKKDDITYNFNLSNDIYVFIEKLPISIKDKIKSYFYENVYVYFPKIGINVICNRCNSNIFVRLSPTFDFLSNFFDEKDAFINIKEIENFVDLYEQIFILSNENFTSVKEFLDMPYPFFVKIVKKLSKSFEKRNKLFENKFSKIFKSLSGVFKVWK